MSGNPRGPCLPVFLTPWNSTLLGARPFRRDRSSANCTQDQSQCFPAGISEGDAGVTKQGELCEWTSCAANIYWP